MTPLDRAVNAVERLLGVNDELCGTPEDIVRAVLMAIRDIDLQTENDAEINMLVRGVTVLPAFDAPMPSDALDCWQAMIDAALGNAKD